MKNFILLIVTCLCVISKANSQENIITPAQQYIYRYNVILHVEDSIVTHTNGSTELVQKYSLRLGRYQSNIFFNLTDKVGFRVLLDYDSSITPAEPLDFKIRFLDYVDGSENYPLVDIDEDEDLGGLRPIIIPPIDEDDEEGFPVESDEQQFVFEEPGEKRLIFELHLGDGHSDDTIVAGVRGAFFVRGFSNPNDIHTLNPTQNNDIEVYPNPIQSNLYIKSSLSDKETNAQIHIYTTTGVKLYTSEQLQGKENSNHTIYHFNNPDVSPGLYYYVIHIGDKIYTKPLLKK